VSGDDFVEAFLIGVDFGCGCALWKGWVKAKADSAGGGNEGEEEKHEGFDGKGINI
jgi:hypothetical protein